MSASTVATDAPVDDTFEQQQPPAEDERHLGRCKWFDERKGYGFIVVCDGPSANSDVFVHYKDLRPLVNTHKSLRKGEYVSLSLAERNDGKSQAVEVTGVMGGPLMCDHFSRTPRGTDSRETAGSA